MECIPQTELSNRITEVLARVAAGETIAVSDDEGRPVAVVGPPAPNPLADLVAAGQVREAVAPPSTLRSIRPRRAARSTTQILGDIRGRW